MLKICKDHFLNEFNRSNVIKSENVREPHKLRKILIAQNSRGNERVYKHNPIFLQHNVKKEIGNYQKI